MAEKNALATYMEAADQFTKEFSNDMQDYISRKSIPLVANGKLDTFSDIQVRQLALFHMFEYITQQTVKQMERHTYLLINEPS